MMVTNSPSLISTLMRRSTYVRLVPWAYDFSIFRKAMSAFGATASAEKLSGCRTGWVVLEKNDMSS